MIKVVIGNNVEKQFLKGKGNETYFEDGMMALLLYKSLRGKGNKIPSSWSSPYSRINPLEGKETVFFAHKRHTSMQYKSLRGKGNEGEIMKKIKRYRYKSLRGKGNAMNIS